MSESKTPAARLFVVKVVGEDGLIGYAVAQRVAFIPASRGGSENVVHAIEQLFAHEKVKLEALPLPAKDDPNGPGLLMFASGGPGDDD